jgi:hypothetical protein
MANRLTHISDLINGSLANKRTLPKDLATQIFKELNEFWSSIVEDNCPDSSFKTKKPDEVKVSAIPIDAEGKELLQEIKDLLGFLTKLERDYARQATLDLGPINVAPNIVVKGPSNRTPKDMSSDFDIGVDMSGIEYSNTLSLLEPIGEGRIGNAKSWNNLDFSEIDQAGRFFKLLMRSDADPHTAQALVEKEIVRTYEDKTNDESELYKMYEDFREYLKTKGMAFEDMLFPPNISSLVNNPRKATLPWKNSEMTRIGNLWDNPTYLANYEPEYLFNFKGILPNLAAVLSAFCEFPDRIKNMFLTKELNVEGTYLGRVFHKGWWKPVMVDDYVPHDSLGEPIALTGTCDVYHSKKEIWPNILAKILAKHYINYQRLTQQTVPEFLKDLSGMPTKTYKTRRLDFSQIRKCWSKNYIVVCKANKEFKAKYVNGKHNLDVYCHLIHAIDLNKNTSMLQFKNYSHQIANEVTFDVSEKLMIGEDWQKYKKYVKSNANTFWVSWEDFQIYFNEAYVCHYDDEMQYDFQKFVLKESDKFAVNIKVTKSMPCYIEVDQLDKLFAESSYNYSDVRIYIIKRDFNKDTRGTVSTLYKATMSSKTRTAMIESDLTKGSYTIICECPKDSNSHIRDYVLSVYYPKHQNFEMELENPMVKKRAYVDMICGTAIQNGVKDYLTENENVRRYTFWSEKLKLFVYVFTNNSVEKFCILEKLQISGQYTCNIALEEDYMKLYLPAMSKKAVIFKFEKSSEAKVKVLEHSMQAIFN